MKVRKDSLHTETLTNILSAAGSSITEELNLRISKLTLGNIYNLNGARDILNQTPENVISGYIGRTIHNSANNQTKVVKGNLYKGWNRS